MVSLLSTQQLNIDERAISGITGSISIACWIVVFSPQIIVNFQRGSAEGLSLTFLIVWLIGDVFNMLGAIIQGVLPTMVILAAYYTLADIILVFQCLYYRSKSSSSKRSPGAPVSDTTSSSSSSSSTTIHPGGSGSADHSVTTPLLPSSETTDPLSSSPMRSILLNITAVLLVCSAGVLGWWISNTTSTTSSSSSRNEDKLEFSPLGQTFGYLCAVLYLASRFPQILLNHRRKSCDGVSLLFFLFACLGNLTYVLSILAFIPSSGEHGGGGVYERYLAVNASWLLGSLGTLGLDMAIFAQFFVYRGNGDGE